MLYLCHRMTYLLHALLILRPSLSLSLPSSSPPSPQLSAQLLAPAMAPAQRCWPFAHRVAHLSADDTPDQPPRRSGLSAYAICPPTRLHPCAERRNYDETLGFVIVCQFETCPGRIRLSYLSSIFGSASNNAFPSQPVVVGMAGLARQLAKRVGAPEASLSSKVPVGLRSTYTLPSRPNDQSSVASRS